MLAASCGAAFDIDALAASGALDGVDLVAVSQSGTEKRATMAAVWRQDAAVGGAFTQSAVGSVAHGYAKTDGSIVASEKGTTAFGYAYKPGSTIEAGAQGGVAHGYAGFGGTIEATGLGSFAHGSAYGGAIVASGSGSFAAGAAAGGGLTVTASAYGSFAFGYAMGGTDVVASAINSVQFGPGTNSIADSLRVGTGIRLFGIGGATPGVLANGDIWLDGDGHVKVRSNGATVSL